VPFESAIAQLAGVAVPASIFETEVLAMRVDNPERSLDEALATGSLLWVGREPAGPRDGRIAVYPRTSFAQLCREPEEPETSSAVHEAILTHLKTSGASFFPDLYAAAGGGDPSLAADAIWDLVWQGAMTNDSFAPLRAFVAKRRLNQRKGRLGTTIPAHVSGRWYLTETLRSQHVPPEEGAIAVAHQLLERYGIVVRDTVLAESIPGGFSGLYPVFSGLEDIGTVRRGYFIEGLGGAQFGLPGAIDRMRSTDPQPLTVLAAADPANIYGSIVPWPDGPGRPNRRAGSRIVLLGGALIAWMDPAGKRTLLFTEDPVAGSEALTMLATRHGRASISEIDGQAAHDHRLAPTLREVGFTPGYKGFTVLADRTQRGAGHARKHR
jgi:ATP-dependent Lhr-like helicase